MRSLLFIGLVALVCILPTSVHSVGRGMTGNGVSFPGPVIAGAGDCASEITDDFSSGDEGTEWSETVDSGNDVNWELNVSSSGEYSAVWFNNTISNKYGVALNATPVSDADQWVCAVLADIVNGPSDIDYGGLVLRADSDAATSSLYQVGFGAGTTTALWRAADDSNNLGTCTLSAETADVGDTLCARVDGTGTSTVFSAWINPTGADPDEWGTAHCCINNGGTDGCEISSLELTGSNITDTGLYLGFRYLTQGTEIGDHIDFDDFEAGTCL